MNENGSWKNVLVVLGGAIVGGVIGHYSARWIATYGICPLVLPGALLGLGGGLWARSRSLLRGALCAVAGLGLGVFTGWKIAPFVADESLGYYATHIHHVPAVVLMIAGGGACAFWLGQGRERLGVSPVPNSETR